MRFVIRSRQVGGPADAAGAAAETAVDVPAWPIALIGAIAGAIPAVVSVLTFVFVTRPDADEARREILADERMCAVMTATQLPTELDRRAALRLMLATGALDASIEDALRDTTLHVPQIPVTFEVESCAATGTAAQSERGDGPPSVGAD